MIREILIALKISYFEQKKIKWKKVKEKKNNVFI